MGSERRSLREADATLDFYYINFSVCLVCDTLIQAVANSARTGEYVSMIITRAYECEIPCPDRCVCLSYMSGFSLISSLLGSVLTAVPR
jgi:hypothetical protein